MATPDAIGQPGQGPPDGLRLQLRRWAGLLVLVGLALPGPAGAPADMARADSGRAVPPSRGPVAGAAAEIPLPLGDPWEAAVVEPQLEPPASTVPWEAVASEPDGRPLPAPPAVAAPAAPAAPATRRPMASTAPAAAPGERARGDAATAPSSSGLVPSKREYLRKTLVRYAQENGLPADLVMALAWKESSWRAKALSDAGAIGVMQLMPSTVEFTSRKLMGLNGNLNPRDAVSNIRMGTRFLRHLVDQSGADYRRALIAYNQGITSLKSRGSSDESEGFADTVLALRTQFRRP